MHLTQLLVQMGAILLLGRVLTRVLRRVGQPSVVAEIVAGIALGPSILGVLWPEGLAMLFPTESLDVLGMIAQLGLVFFMFLVGLEFDPKLLRGQLRTSLAVANVGILVPLLAGGLLALGLHADLAPTGVSKPAFALFLGTAMSVTAFPVLARILTEARLIRTRVGALALAAAAVGDVSAWCLLALVIGVVDAGGVISAVQTTGLTLAYCALVWFVVRPALARIGPREGGGVSTEVVTLIVLAVLASSAVTEWIGVHALFGAFLIGSAMPREGGVATALNERLEDFVSIVLLPLFFAYSGLRTQIGLLDSADDWVTCALITAVACLGKFGGTALVGWWTGLSRREATTLGVLMNTRGLMELVVLNVGLDLGVISPRLFAMMVVMALFTTWITAPLVRWLYPSQGTFTESPTATVQPIPAVAGGVLICVADPAVAAALVQLARALNTPGEPVFALHLRPTERTRDYLRDDAEAVTEPLDAVERAAEAIGLKYEPLSYPSADPAADIVRIATLRGVRTVLIGVHRSVVGRENLAGAAGRILRDCPGEVAVLVDHSGLDLRALALRSDLPGPAGVASRLERGGVRRVEVTKEADLLVGACAPGGRLPEAEGPSWLLVRTTTVPEALVMLIPGRPLG